MTRGAPSRRPRAPARQGAGLPLRVIGASMVLLLTAIACGGEGSSRVGSGGGNRVEVEEHMQRGLEMMRQGQDEGAEAEFRRAIALDPQDARAHLQLGKLLAGRGLRAGEAPREGTAEIEKAVELAPGDLQARLELADVLHIPLPNHFDSGRAIELYEGVLKERPELSDVRLRYATWLATADVRLVVKGKAGRVSQDSSWTMESARRQLEIVIDTVPADSPQAAVAHAMIANILMHLGQWPESVRECDLVLDRHPDLSTEKRADLLWTKGQSLYRQGLYRDAIATYRAQYDLLPSDRPLWDIYQCSLKLKGFPAGLPPKYRFPLRPEASGRDLPPAPRFRDIAQELGIAKYAGAGPASWGDYDGDGLYDLIVCGCDTFCSLFHNEGKKFRDVTLEAGLGGVESGFAVPWGDYDGDGLPDLYIARNGWSGPAPDTLLRNKGDGTFEDVTARSGINEPGSGFHSQWLDYDRDGWLDLFVTNGVTFDPNINHLYRNKRDGSFTDVTATAGLKEVPWRGTIGVAIGDFDGDGFKDLFLHGRKSPNRLYHNLGNGTFEEVARQAGVAGNSRQNGFVALAVDLDSDGDLDILTVSLTVWDRVLRGYRSDYRPGPDDDRVRFYRNDGGLRFTDVSEAAGFIYPMGIMAANAGDVDNDGYMDIRFGTGDPDSRRLEPNKLYMNTGHGTFVDRTIAAGVETLGKGHGITFIDWNGDGYLEMYTQLGGFYHGDLWNSAFYLNETPHRNHYIEIDLREDGPNRLAVGAGVQIEAGELRTYQEVTAGRGFGSSDPPTLHFGLGGNTLIDRLRVRWPDGTSEQFERPPVDRRILIRRGDRTWTTVTRGRPLSGRQ